MATEIEIIQKVALYSVPALLGIILHEVAHGYAAYRLGDPTAKSLGRLTINPFPHIDPIGLLVFVVTSITSPFVFGWAKPVPVDTRYFRDPLRDMVFVALAGPATNFLLAAFFSLLLWLGLEVVPPSLYEQHQNAVYVLIAFKAGVYINLALAWLNLIPVPPLDGSKVLAYFIPPSYRRGYWKVERYGMLILLFLIICGVLSHIITPLIEVSARLILFYLS